MSVISSPPKAGEAISEQRLLRRPAKMLGGTPRNDGAFFQITSGDSHTQARTGSVRTPHGTFQTPAFMPVGTQGTVKGLTPRNLKEAGAEIILSNAYHLFVRPGIEIIRDAGGLHSFMGWPGPLLTDSGGYQVFSLCRGTARRASTITQEGVTFQSHVDGREIFLTPEKVIEIQEILGSDIAMVLDECPPHSRDRNLIKNSLDLTVQWAKRAKVCHQRKDRVGARRAVPLLFGIVQGGIFEDLRMESVERTVELDFDGYALGGFFVGESREETLKLLERISPRLPGNRPRYLMGAGTPVELLEAVSCGIDLFDCVTPTRYGRYGSAFTSKGLVVVRNGKYNQDFQPLDGDCRCYTCQNFSRSYLRHLFNSGEMLGPGLVSLHNVQFFIELMKRVRREIEAGTFPDFKRGFERQFDPAQR